MNAAIPQAVGDNNPIYLEQMDSWGSLPGMSSLDENQQLYAERLIGELAMQNPDGSIEKIERYAIKQALECMPTLREAANAVAAMRSGPCHCYLAFYGFGTSAQFLKIGITKHPEQRLYGIATGNPLDCLWVYTAKFSSRASAYRAEQMILKSQAFRKRRGEWISLESCDEAASRELADHLGIVSEGEDFALLTYRDGRAVA
jgi:hypothetical protein